MSTDRTPYVGEGRDGCYRSARIDEEEADMLDRDDPRRDTLLESAAAWREQARRACPICDRNHPALPRDAGRSS